MWHAAAAATATATATRVVGLFHPKTCETTLHLFPGRPTLHSFSSVLLFRWRSFRLADFRAYLVKSPLPSPSPLPILAAAALPQICAVGCQRRGPAHLSRAAADARMTLIKVIDVWNQAPHVPLV